MPEAVVRAHIHKFLPKEDVVKNLGPVNQQSYSDSKYLRDKLDDQDFLITEVNKKLKKIFKGKVDEDLIENCVYKFDNYEMTYDKDNKAILFSLDVNTLDKFSIKRGGMVTEIVTEFQAIEYFFKDKVLTFSINEEEDDWEVVSESYYINDKELDTYFKAFKRLIEEYDVF